ncbi:MAG TPA: glycosyltransferase family 4 protein [Thermoanaerobaculia bacterium]|nr:glycosyltransferase family 4 protein [Thermoanaerobaculia bacterium]
METNTAHPIRVLLTVPHLESVASPYREMMAIANHLPRPEFDLTICSLRENGRAEVEPTLRELGVEVFVARIRPRGPHFSNFRSCWKDRAVIRARGPFDLQHSLDFSSTPFEAGLAAIDRRPFIFTQRNLNEGGSRFLLRTKCSLARRVVAISAAVGRLLADLGTPTRKVVTIGLGLEEVGAVAEDTSNLPARGRYVLSVGHIEQRKRHEDAINAFAMVANEMPELSLLIVGRVVVPAYQDRLTELVKECGLEKRVFFLGPRKDVLALMRGADCLFHCPESEALGWVLLEAMSVGLPVVATDAGGIPEVIVSGQTGMLIPVGDVAAGAAALRTLLSDPALAKTLTTKARSAVREFSATTMVDRLAEVYRNLLQRAAS